MVYLYKGCQARHYMFWDFRRNPRNRTRTCAPFHSISFSCLATVRLPHHFKIGKKSSNISSISQKMCVVCRINTLVIIREQHRVGIWLRWVLLRHKIHIMSCVRNDGWWKLWVSSSLLSIPWWDISSDYAIVEYAFIRFPHFALFFWCSWLW